ncbi:MAG TPA: hypothetical protein VGF76_25745 [Polyangiaceae bacterium]|jgi:hypothetical protein
MPILGSHVIANDELKAWLAKFHHAELSLLRQRGSPNASSNGRSVSARCPAPSVACAE